MAVIRQPRDVVQQPPAVQADYFGLSTSEIHRSPIVRQAHCRTGTCRGADLLLMLHNIRDSCAGAGEETFPSDLREGVHAAAQLAPAARLQPSSGTAQQPLATFTRARWPDHHHRQQQQQAAAAAAAGGGGGSGSKGGGGSSNSRPTGSSASDGSSDGHYDFPERALSVLVRQHVAVQGRHRLGFVGSKGPGRRHSASSRVGVRLLGIVDYLLRRVVGSAFLEISCRQTATAAAAESVAQLQSCLLPDSLRMTSPQDCGCMVDAPEEVALAADFLHPAIAGVWAPAAAWQLEAVRAGVRAMPRRTNEGTPPLTGRLESPPGSSELQLGVAAADDESLLAPQLRRWRH